MQSRELTADILVPREFVWWTFLALAADPRNPFAHIRFVQHLKDDSDVAIIDSRLLPQNDELLRRKQRIAVLLWDGYQSYLQLQSAIDHVREVSRKFELRVVGSFSELEDNHSLFCSPLFAQDGGVYDESVLSHQSLSKFSFEKPASKFSVMQRSNLLSLKASMQLASTGRIARYRRTRFVYCGQSGIETLKDYAADYGFDTIQSLSTDAEPEFLSAWLTAIHQRPAQWTNGIIRRALLRIVALRCAAESLGDELFLNVFPEPNVNAYQAGWLFRKHTFLDFGGMNGDEAVYPRAADILFHHRKSLRFDRTEALRRLQNMDGSSLAASHAFFSWYRQSIEMWLVGVKSSRRSGRA